MSNVGSEIRQGVKHLLEHQGFRSWLASERPETGDYVIVNNSFVFRDVKTVKSDLYLCLVVGENGKIKPEPKIASGIRLNSDFRRFSGHSRNLHLTDLDRAVSNQISNVGQILLVLIGQVKDTVVLREPVNHESFGTISWDPSISDQVYISGDYVAVREVHDEGSIWQAIEEHFQSMGQDVPSGLREAIGIALDKLQEQAIAEVEIPPFGTSLGSGVTDAIVRVLREQRDHYHKALTSYTSGKEPSALNEVLRVAYNFASDAIGYIRLIVSICDLKPIVLWGTIAEHYALSEGFRELPWTRSRNKPSLRNYQLTISDARNSTFHDLFPFRKTLRIPLPDDALQGVELRLFSEHMRKKDNQLTYRDKELVDILTEFTRARERRVSDHFWRQNLQVMDATIALFAKTGDFLKVLHAEMGNRYQSRQKAG